MGALYDCAMEYATEKHKGQKRKGTDIPYITHLIEAAEIVKGLTVSEYVACAALLHDTMEDAGVTYEELAYRFGTYIANLVAVETEDKSKPWRIRKEETIFALKDDKTEARTVALGDKLSNIRAMLADYQEIGEELWERFNQKDPKEQAWYYIAMADLFNEDDELKGTEANAEYNAKVHELFDRYLEAAVEPVTKPKKKGKARS